MILETEIWINLHSNNISHFEKIGYEIPRFIDKYGKSRVKKGTKILVKVNDLPIGSKARVTKVCDYCGMNVPNQQYGLILSRRESGKDRCHACGKIKGGVSRKEAVSYQESFEFFSKENSMLYLLDEYSDKNELKPSQISFGTQTSVIWNCLSCTSEYFMRVSQRTSGTKCPYCANKKVNHTNDLWKTHSYVAKILLTPEDGHKYTSGSGEKVNFKCLNCGDVNKKIIRDIVRRGYTCHRCGDGVSYPEKFVWNILEQLNVSFETQKSFSWSENKRYDFFIEGLSNTIVEVHGEQHYTGRFESKGGRTLEEEQENDRLKYKKAMESNYINNYIIIDARKSEMEYIKSSILNSNMVSLYNLDDIDWLEAHEFACNSLVKNISELWNSLGSVTEISKIIKLGNLTVRKYLKQGTSLGWCDYDPVEVQINNGKLLKSKYN
jgi:DNA-directed RNA polymerase subunit RPC12/RpoP